MLFSMLYTLGMRGYILLLMLASLYHAKARQMIQGRRRLDEDTSGFSSFRGQSVWFHCASVGEFEQGYPLLKLLRNIFPQYRYHITFYSPSGYDFVRKKYPDESISYLPFDIPSDIVHFIRRIRPRAVFIIKYEYWYQLLRTLHQMNIPVIMVSAILRPDHFLFRWYGTVYHSLLRTIRHFFVQNQETAELLNKVSIGQVSIAGDTRFDRVMENLQEPLSDRKILEFTCNEKVFVGGSVWNSDLPVLQKILQELPRDWKIILAPHDIAHFDPTTLHEPVDLYTQSAPFSSRILILNTVGLLSSVYRLANFSYVGGGFGKGLHNILEPAVFGKPILIGPEYSKFNEAVELVRRGCVFPLQTGDEAGPWVDKIVTDPVWMQQLSEQMEAYISLNTNVSDKIAVFVRREGLL